MFHSIRAAAHYKFAGFFCFLFVLFLCQPLYGGMIEYTIQTGPYDILQEPDGQVIRTDHFGSLGVSGKPKLPYKIFAFALPPGTEMTALHVDGGKAVTLEGAYRIAPAPAPRFVGPEKPDLTAQNQAEWQRNYNDVYTSNAPFPARVGQFVRKAGFRKYNLVDVEIMPFVYQPASGILKYYESVSVKIEYGPRAGGEKDIVLDYSPRMENFASQFIYNYEEAQAWYPRPHDGGSREVNDFVIITTTALSSAVTTLANWESAKGRNVEVVTTDWIYANYTGDDNAEEIRNFLLDKYPTAEWGIEDVLLVGHHTAVPMREVDQNLGYGAPRTDFYYAELSSPDATSWDSNNNNQYGENSDNMNYYPEVYVGRIPWSSALTVQNICQKSMAFEQNNDITFKKNILLLGAYFWSDTDNAVMMEAKVDQPWMADWTMTRMYEKNSSYYSTYPCDYELLHSNVMAVWPNGKYAFVNYAGHGSPTSCHIYGLGAPAFIQGSDCSSLNDNYPAIVFADACSNSDTDYTNIGQSMLEQGAVGFVGATQVALGCPGWNDPTDGSSQSLDYFFTTCVTSGTYTQGAALQYGLVQNYQQGGWDYNCYEICQWGALWGNPDLVLGGDFPDMPSVHYMAHTVDDSAGNGDGFVDAGETITMAVTMENTGSADATAVSATITTDTPGITIHDGTATFPDIPVDENRGSDIPHFNFSVDGTVQVGTYIDFDLDITTAEADFSTSFTQVVGQIEPVFFDDLESGEGDWAHGGNFDEWTLGDPAGSGSASDPGGAYSPSHVWGTDLGADGNYENFSNQWLDSPVVDCSQYTGTLLRYYRYLNIQKGQYDHARIYVNGTMVWENGYSEDIADSGWTYHEVDISEYADGHPYVTWK